MHKAKRWLEALVVGRSQKRFSKLCFLSVAVDDLHAMKWTNRTPLFTQQEVERIVHAHIAPNAKPLREQPRPIKKRVREARSLEWKLVKGGEEMEVFNLGQFARDNGLSYPSLWQAWNRGYKYEGYEVHKKAD